MPTLCCIMEVCISTSCMNPTPSMSLISVISSTVKVCSIRSLRIISFIVGLFRTAFVLFWCICGMCQKIRLECFSNDFLYFRSSSSFFWYYTWSWACSTFTVKLIFEFIWTTFFFNFHGPSIKKNTNFPYPLATVNTNDFLCT